MAALSLFQRSLVRIAQTRGREVLENIIIGQFEVIEQGGGKLVNTSVGGKSFSFQVGRDMEVAALMGHAEMALSYFDAYTETQIDRLLATPLQDKVTARFR